MKRRRFQLLPSQSRTWIPYPVLAGALAVTFLAALYVQRTAVAKDRERFEHSVQEISTTLNQQLDTYVALLRAGTGLFAASHVVEPDEFRRFVAQLELSRHYPGIQGIGFSPRLRADERNNLIQSVRQAGNADFKIWPEGDRPEYYPVLYLEPLDHRNQAALGYDMFTEPARRVAMESARDTGLPVASGRVTLVQEIEEPRQAGFLIYSPVYHNGWKTDTVDERRAALVGFVYGPFRAGDLLQSVLKDLGVSGISFKVYDGPQPEPGNLLYDSIAASKRASDVSRLGGTTTIDVAGRPWTLSFNTNRDFEAGSATNFATLTLLAGGLLSFLLFVVTRSQTRAQVVAQSAARDLRHSEKSLRQSLAERRQAEKARRESEERYRELFENANDIVYTLDLEGKLISVNRAGELITGFRSEELVGKSIAEIAISESQATMAEMLARKLAGQPRTNYEVEIETKGGQHRTIETNSRLMLENGEPVGIQGIARDITERKLAEEKLRAANERAIVEYERLLERIAALAQELGAARELLAIYRALREFATASVPCHGLFVSLYDPVKEVRTAAYGWGDGIEVDVSQLPPMPLTLEGPNSRALRSGEIVITDNYMEATSGHPQVIIGPDNGLRPQSSLALPMSVLGRIIGTIEVQSYERAAYKEEHATAMRMAANLVAVAIQNAQLLARESQARTEAEESNRLKDDFLATVSHELRTPLTAILGWARMLDSGTLTKAQVTRAIQTIQRNAKAQAAMIDDILDVSRIVTGNLYLNLEPTELAPVIEAAINVVKPTAEAKHVEIETVFPAQPAVVSGDARRLQQIVWNLLSNAIRFTRGGGCVRISLKQTDSHVELNVSDNGEGISAEFLPHVFERFRQADSSTTRQHGGLGLGLAIVRHLAEIHGGTVRAQSEGEGKGATFTVTLPLLAVSEFAGAGDVPRKSSRELWQQPELAGIHVLLVDDDAGTREMISAALNERHARVTAVASSQEALSAIRQARPDILVSDIAMPVEDGYKLIEQVRALEPQMIPAIAITAYAREEDRSRALAAGYQSYLPKPIEPAELIAVVAELAS